MRLSNQLVLSTLAFLPFSVLGNHHYVVIDYDDHVGPTRHLREGSTSKTLEQRFLEDVVSVLHPITYGVYTAVPNDASCLVCGGPWVCTGNNFWNNGIRTFQDPFGSGTLCGITATVKGICQGIEDGVTVKLNGNVIGVAVGQEDSPGCWCDTCNTGSQVSLSPIDPTWYNIGNINEIQLSTTQNFICVNRVELVLDFCESDGNGDPHFRTWKNEHFEFHGQCDLVMTKVKDFAGEGLDLDIHLRTSMVRYWSYIKSAAIRIGNDILEVEGSAAKEDGLDKRHYRINYEYRGPLTTLGGFPVTISPRNNVYTIDLDSKYPGQKIEIKTFKEFVGVKIIGANAESFGNAVGITGNFHTGKTLARDGHSEIHDFNDLGLEWQVMPSDGKLFHDAAKPQFPELCYLPEDARGERARRLAESNITEEAAEEACAGLEDEFDRKGCVYDILATQDLEMVGAY